MIISLVVVLTISRQYFSNTGIHGNTSVDQEAKIVLITQHPFVLFRIGSFWWNSDMTVNNKLHGTFFILQLAVKISRNRWS